VSYIKKKTKNTTQFIPRNPKKYVGKYPIIVRSSWERMFFQWLDVTESVVEWSSEGTTIKYFDPVLRRVRRYYPDAYMKVNTGKRYIIEIKPEKDLRLPRKLKKSKKTIAIREQTYVTNQAKFEAAREYCKKLGMTFKVLTEKDLFTEGKK
jgi:hypothetical protein